MTDIVWLLRNDVPCGAGVCCAGELCNQAADEIERLRAALERIAFGKYHWEADAQEEARAALETREAGVSSEVKND